MIKQPVKRPYRARADGWVNGQRVSKDEIVNLTAQQAQYEPVDEVRDVKPARRRDSEAAGEAKPQ